ncbi:metallophosphoesterase [Leptospira sp. GIMC2001]|uniref:metallophosphoesterase n=1 Tax=Leptospira sp. GIMC2001 TaxID=1513297 RepID=UPI0023493CEA|nr:metallophosphoesterase [Leptospira sp. GIMC2001]WCL51305.1 metallophosphoesterase [Leptospira sp. GIMC2001]
MIIFLSVFTSLIAAGYFYIGRSLIQSLQLDSTSSFCLWLLIAFLVFSIPISYYASHSVNHARIQSALSFVAFLSLGFFTILLTMIVVMDLVFSIWKLLNFIPLIAAIDLNSQFSKIFGDLVRVVGLNWNTNDPFLGQLVLTLFFLFVTAILTIWGMFQATTRIKTVNVEVSATQHHKDLKGFKIVQISDVHIGPTIKRPFLQHVVNRINNMNPDIVVITGDLVDGPASQFKDHLLPLADLKSKYGTFFVTGNHEYYSGVLTWIQIIKNLGISVLLNENTIINHNSAKIALGGVTDLKAGSILPQHATNPHASIQGGEDADYKILLAHQPNSILEASKVGYDLQLSGHTHGGQYFPGNLIIYLVQKFVAGLHVYNKTTLYVSRGTGYWGPPLRIGAPSEITSIVLK